MGRTILYSAFIRRLVIVALAVALAGMLYLAALAAFAPTTAVGQGPPLDAYQHTNYFGVRSAFYLMRLCGVYGWLGWS